MSDEQKLLAACEDYRAKLDKLEAENAALNETTKKHVAAYYELLAENAALRERVADLVSNLAAAHEDRSKTASDYFRAKQVEIPELLRGNSALREALDAQMKYQRDLRADRDRLDWLMTQKHIRYPFAPHDDGKVLRQRIDAAMGKGKL